MTSPPAPRPAPLLRLLRYARGRRGTVAWAAACSVINKVLDLAPPVIIGVAVDVVVQREDSLLAGLGLVSAKSQLVALTVATVVIFVLESLFEYLYALAWRNLGQSLQHDLRLDAYAHVQRLELSFFEDKSTGGLMSVLNDDVNQLERFLDGGANDLLQVATTVLVVGGMFVWLAPTVAWAALLPMPVILWASFWFQRTIAPRYAAVREQAGLLNGQLANNLQGIATIKSFTAEAHEVDRVREGSEAYRQANRRAIALSAAFSPLIRMVIVVAVCVTLLPGGLLVLDGRLSAGEYSVLVFLIQRLLWPLTRLGATFDLYQRAMASTARILDVLDQPVRIVGGGAALPRAEVKGELALDGVTFEYVPGHPVLRDLTLRIPAGETTAVVGATGGGKSTIVKLLLRLYEPTRGRVLLDGRDVRDLDLAALRGAIGLVSQDTFLFHGTVRENIAYGTFDATEEQVVAAAKAAEAHEFIVRLPRGYDTIVGERGQKLSGGQRQRISIARAVLKDPPVLVLDEATSSVDNETEAAIQRSLERLARGRTTLVIAHRLSTVRNAHRIHVLEDGQVREAGRHEELLDRDDGLYAALWRVQTGVAAGA
ncbi:MAG: ABC transporter ATP-binding protein [Planctomycetes bacterium]|nr:ABC transporter ATP-binding protein [Planctomycetota bacterium]